MEKTLRPSHHWLLGLLLLLSACVTVNVYFPAPAMHEAAERIVREVWGEQRQQEAPPPAREPAPAADPGPQSRLSPGSIPAAWRQGGGALLAGVLELLSRPAHAGADINVSTAAIRQLKGSIQQRAGQLRRYMDAGNLGIAANGDLVIRDEDGLAVRDRATLRRLVQAENADRDALYREIAAANGHPEWAAQVREVFAQKWQEQAARGWWIQRGGWQRR